jgi:hypothetical protein
MKGRVTALVVIAFLAVAGSAGAATFAPHVLCGASCGTLVAGNGSGTLRMTATGTTYGGVGDGVLAIRDLSNNGWRDFSVSGWSRTWKKDGFQYYAGRNMSYFASTTWTIKIYATSGATSSMTANGHGYIKGSGRWSRNNHGTKSWPTAGQTFQLSASS